MVFCQRMKNYTDTKADELHVLLGLGKAEGSIDASNLIKPALSRGELQCCGATTLNEYRLIEKDVALARRFQPILVGEPSVADTISILRGIKDKYEVSPCLLNSLCWLTNLGSGTPWRSYHR